MYALYVVVPHELPSVVRMQACVSGVLTVPQLVPVPAQRRSVRVRVCTPLVAHAAPPSQVDHAEKLVVPQPTPASANASEGHAALVPEHRSSTSQPPPAAARQTRLGPRSEHVPSVAAPCATLHASHAPLHAVSQHTPSTQLFEVHSVPIVHATPLVFLAEQYVPLQ